VRFAGSIFLSAFLLFQVQLILGKHLLPWFGGSPAVWTTCILFFQAFLLLGYAYAFFIDRRITPSGQFKLHGSVILLALAGLGLAWLTWGSPMLPSGPWKATAGALHPIAGVLLVLLVSVGLPYLVLAANSPLVQSWYGMSSKTTTPYRLYAVSNIGSLLALLSYPFLVEPTIPLRAQALVWTTLFSLFAVATLACMAGAMKAAPSGRAFWKPVEAAAEPAGLQQRIFWMVLAACPSCMLLAITNDLSQEVAVTPFIWVLPLAIYLLSFIICFDHARWYSRRLFVLLTYATSMAVLITNLKGFGLGVMAHLLSYSAFLFCFCMVCHGELYRMRPARERLTSFYLTIALGGVTGGAIVGILAPLLFRDYWEFHLTILTSWVLLTWIFWKDKSSFLNTGDRWHFFGLVLLASYIITHYTLAFSGMYQAPFIRGHKELANLLLALLSALVIYLPVSRLAFIRNPLWPRLLLGMLIFVVESFAVARVRGTSAATVYADRNFFGVVKITEETLPFANPLPVWQMIHGKILHGFQYMRADLELRPNSYYVHSSGIGMAFQLQRLWRQDRPLRVGVTGLGVGAITAHIGQGDFIRFYEINPLVVDHAYGPGATFTYLNRSAGTVDVQLGDARLLLENALAANGSEKFDLLVLDAFSSDSIPVHLLTREAFDVYMAHLRDDQSILAVNITNRILDLRDLMLSTARDLGCSAVIIKDPGEVPLPTTSVWVLMSRDQGLLLDPRIQARAEDGNDFKELIWTDNFSNLYKVLRQRRGFQD
jgi:spermidine synthase